MTYTPTITLTIPGLPVVPKLNLSAFGEEPEVGARFTYSLKIHNDSSSDIHNMRIWDSLPANIKFVESIFSEDPVIVSGNYVEWDLSGTVYENFKAGQVLVIEFVVEITQITDNDLIINEITIDYNDPYYFEGGPYGRHPEITSNAAMYPQDRVVIFPNPFNPRTARGNVLKFLNVIPGSLINIYTVSGEHVTTIKAASILETWDGKNNMRKMCSPGIYYWLVINPYNNSINKGKLFIVSK